MPSQIVRADNLRSVAHGSISGSYVALGSKFAHPMRILHFVNQTDGDLIISFDGIADNLFIPAGSFVLYDFCANEDPSLPFYVSNNTQIYVKQSSAPSSGSVYLMAFYGLGE